MQFCAMLCKVISALVFSVKHCQQYFFVLVLKIYIALLIS